jgi:hypothetical protein
VRREGSVPQIDEIVDPGQGDRLSVLTEEVDVVTEPRERLREARVVDVAAGAAEQVAVEDQDSDSARLACVSRAPPDREIDRRPWAIVSRR